MRLKAILLVSLVGVVHVAAFDVTVDIRDHVQRNASNVTDAYMITNEAYPNRSPFDVEVNTTLFFVNNTSMNQSRTLLDVNKYSYADTSNVNITSNTSKLCVNVEAVNRSDANESNNNACKAFFKSKNDSEKENKANQSSEQSNRSIGHIGEDDKIESSQGTVDASQTTSSRNTSRKSSVKSDSSCRLLSDIPAVIQGDQTIKFDVNADGGSVTYWAENQRGEVIKSKVTTTNSGTKQYTPDDEPVVVLKASRNGCEQKIVSAAVKADKMESYVNIEEVSAKRPKIRATISHHDTGKRALSLTTQSREIGELVLPGGTTRFTTSFPAVELENGVSTLNVETDDDEDSFKYRLQEESLKERYPDLIESVYHRKEQFGPTTVYISLKERVSGEVVVRQRNRVERRDINDSNIDITVMPSAPTERLSISVNNRLGETVDETTHRLDLDRANTTAKIREEKSDSPDERGRLVAQNSSDKSKPHNSSDKERVEAFDESSERTSTPYLSATGLLAALGYCAYWMGQRT